MTKILITTFHNAHNYGAVLQAFALCKKIKELNKANDVKIINYKNDNILRGYRLFTPIRKNIIKWIPMFLSDIKNYHKNKMRYIEFDNFINKKLTLTGVYYTAEELKENPPEADVYITGSDQVWNPKIVGKLSDIYTLNFGNKSVRRISYAASVGETNLILKDSYEFQNKLKNLNFISVREESAKTELEKITNTHIETVLDPTLLLTVAEWDNELKTTSVKIDCKYILAYVVEPDNEYIKIVNELSRKTGLQVIHFGKNNPGYNNVLKSAYTEGPLNFINYIKNAEYVIATSFHATVFSVLYQKKFFIIPNKKTGGRVTNLLEKLKIKNRVYYSLETFKKIDYTFITNWSDVEKNLTKERNKSINWLNNALKSNKGRNINE